MYQLELIDSFKRDLKKLTKKYPRIKKDLSELFTHLEKGNFQGDELQGFPGLVYKPALPPLTRKKARAGALEPSIML